MKQFLRSILVVFLFPVVSFSQTGIYIDFNNNILDPGWKSVPSGKFTFTAANQVLQVDASSVGADYSNIEYDFSTQNISQNPVVKLKVKTAVAFTMRIDVIDVNGTSNNASPVSQPIAANSNYTEYTFNYTGHFGSADFTQIKAIVIFLNAGGPAFTGTVYFDDLIIGDSIPYVNLVAGPIRINQVGYETNGPKIAVLEHTTNSDTSTTFSLIDTLNKVVYSGTLTANGQVPGWSGRYFWTADFSDFTTAGTYRVKIGSIVSYPFEIGDNLLFSKTASSAVDFFKGMRNTMTSDYTLSFYGPRNDIVNVYGGWWDATGDPGKHFSHLSYANYFNPQQIPMVVWSLLKSYDLDKNAFSSKAADLQSEAAWGADYLLRNLDKTDNYFYLSVFDDWGNNPSSREICEWSGSSGVRSANYQCAFREGGGMAIAALARAYNMGLTGDSSSQQYLAGAKRAYTHLKAPGSGYATKNLEYDNNHQENIIDDYCALMAATELYKATGTQEYLTDAGNRAGSLMNRITAQGWFASDDAHNRPFFHAADEGLPLLALLSYMEIDDSKNAQIISTIHKNLSWYFSISQEVTNPFHYIREYGKPYDTTSKTFQPARTAFFLPHVNETGYWWQGENARLASMTTALLLTSRVLNPEFSLGNDSISTFSIAQLDWILGKNPFDVCMMFGFGQNNYPNYPSVNNKANVVGGICNGITAKDSANEMDIAWKPYANSNWENWRWIEQWLPHDLWFLLAVSSISHLNNTPGMPIAAFGPVNLTPGTSGTTIDWTTTSEVNGNVLLLQKSTNGTGFTTIDTLTAMGTPNSTTSYTFQDTTNTTTAYYRVVFVDMNGNTLTSSVASMTVSSNTTAFQKQQATIYPNPFTDNTWIEIPDNFSGAKVLIYDASGRLMEETIATEHSVSIGKKLIPGFYQVELRGDKGIKTGRIIKM